jgi:hypothetical protein
MYDLIQNGEIKFPIRNPLSHEAVDIISQLLNRDADTRLGVNGSEEVKSHAFFNGINWEAMMRKEVQPPFQPTISNEHSVENFDREFT